MDSKWQCNQMGWKEWNLISEKEGKCNPNEHVILHWAGAHKPWHDDGTNKPFWTPFVPSSCKLCIADGDLGGVLLSDNQGRPVEAQTV